MYVIVNWRLILLHLYGVYEYEVGWANINPYIIQTLHNTGLKIRKILCNVSLIDVPIIFLERHPKCWNVKIFSIIIFSIPF